MHSNKYYKWYKSLLIEHQAILKITQLNTHQKQLKRKKIYINGMHIIIYIVKNKEKIKCYIIYT